MLGVRIPPGLPTLLNLGVGGPSDSEEAAKRCTELTRTGGPTLNEMNPVEKIKDWAQNAKQFYNDVRSEMKKVSWPGRQEVMGTTIVVIVAVFFFGLYLGAVDQLLGIGLNWVLRYFGVTGGA